MTWAMATLAAAIVIVLSLALLAFFILFAPEAERYTSGISPTQFNRQLDVELLDDYAGVFGVAHNSGDSLAATREALDKGADIIEIDVVMSGGKLYAGHDSPVPFIGDRFFRGPRLEEVWRYAVAAEAVKLDLKERSPAYLDAVIAFLKEAPEEVLVIVATRDVTSLERFADQYPTAIRLLSVPGGQAFEGLQESPDLQSLIDGITIRHTVLDGEIARWLEEEGFLVFAWTVNDAERMNELVRMGVDAITTDNLAIMQLLGGQTRGESRLEYRLPR